MRVEDQPVRRSLDDPDDGEEGRQRDGDDAENARQTLRERRACCDGDENGEGKEEVLEQAAPRADVLRPEQRQRREGKECADGDRDVPPNGWNLASGERIPRKGDRGDAEHDVQRQQPAELAAVCDRNVEAMLAPEVEREPKRRGDCRERDHEPTRSPQQHRQSREQHEADDSSGDQLRRDVQPARTREEELGPRHCGKTYEQHGAPSRNQDADGAHRAQNRRTAGHGSKR